MHYHSIMRVLSSVCLYNYATKNKTFISYTLLQSIMQNTPLVLEKFNETVIITAYFIIERNNQL